MKNLEKLKKFALTKEQMSKVVGGDWVKFQLANGSKIDVWRRTPGEGTVTCTFGVKDGDGIFRCWTPPAGSRML